MGIDQRRGDRQGRPQHLGGRTLRRQRVSRPRDGQDVGAAVDPHGTPLDRAAYERRLDDWIPSERDRAFVHSLMQKVIEPGKMAGWIAPPERGINNLAIDYEYVKLH